MRKTLSSIPLQVPIGRVPAALADEIVAAGAGISLKGRAILLLSLSGLEQLLSELNADPETAGLILRAVKILEATRADTERAAASSAHDATPDGESEGR